MHTTMHKRIYNKRTHKIIYYITYTPHTHQHQTTNTLIMSDDDNDDQPAKQKPKQQPTKQKTKQSAPLQGAPLRKMPTIREIAINILLNMSLFIISLYLLWIYYGWSASYSSTYVTVYADVKAAQKRVDAAKKAAAANPKAPRNKTAEAYDTCLTYGWLMLPRPMNDAYAYSNFWIQYGLSRYVSSNLSLYDYGDWVKLLS